MLVLKLVSYRLKKDEGAFRIGFIYNEQVFDVQQCFQRLLESREEDLIESIELFLPSDPNKFFAMGSDAIERAQKAFDYIRNDQEIENLSFTKQQVNIGIPVPNPGKIICIGQNYADHVVEMDSKLPKHPVLFAKFSNALIGPEDSIQKSPLTNQLDYEVELVIVMGKEASEINKEDALDYIAGYTIGNDTSARDLQKRTPQWLQGKSHDNSTPIGPYIVTSDEISDPENLGIRSYINGEKRQESTTNELIFDIPTLIKFISDLITLQPGDIIFTGTPHGVGAGMNPPQFLNVGDVVTLEIDEIGKLENKIIEKR